MITVTPQTTEKANLLNNFFLNYSTIETSNATLPEAEYLINERLENLFLSEDEVCNILKSLKVSKASGPDGISPRMLKMTATSITKPMTRYLISRYAIIYLQISGKERMFHQFLRKEIQTYAITIDQSHYFLL